MKERYIPILGSNGIKKEKVEADLKFVDNNKCPVCLKEMEEVYIREDLELKGYYCKEHKITIPIV